MKLLYLVSVLPLFCLLQTKRTSCVFKKQAMNEEPVCLSRFDYDYKIVQKLVTLEKAYSELKEVNDLLQKEIGSMKKDTEGSRSLYIRWGRTECPGNGTEMVYRGYTAGRHYTKGGGTSTLCLPEKPTWARYDDSSNSYRGYIWGAEIDMDVPSEGKVFEQNVDGQDQPCVVCTTPRAVTHMFPGRANCFPGWSTEYTGYLMTNYKDRSHNMEYFCLDASPEGIPKGGASDHENVIYLVEAKCGSLPCPPYVEGREVACAVCSK